MKNPVERLAETLLKGDKQRAALVFSAQNRRYLTEFPSSAGALFITCEEAWLLTDFRYTEAAGKKAKYCKAVGFQNMNDSLGELIDRLGVKEIYLEIDKLSVAQARVFEKLFAEHGARAVLDDSLDAVLRRQRMIKSPEEVKKIEAAQQITDAAFQHILPCIKEGVTEREIALEIEFFMRRNGAEDVAFSSIIAAGENGSQCHAVPSDYQIRKGDLITMDTGAKLDGYHSDMTRTVALGHVSEEQRAIYNKVLEAHLAVIDFARPGVKCCQVDKVARDLIDEAYPGTFGHGLGHGVGFEIHEWPRFSATDETLTEAGMVITDEPGIYIAGKCGVRIEDMVLITEEGCRSLTKSPKELIEL